ncbi:UDP-N-acetylglucosamine 2-epimerase (non-hydrolyzing) [Variovorax beijingensis]|uniref:UDP-N-acetylglucosamine 2-epimerase (Non-hydrolyzing) n=1 Tax=Variovorax beijingensis TaxID=2496117 RepID=A0A3P3EPC3_9BURK|nr:UDP-N-acetylglucosamine 2-epimerase (non-hydrolyzing) [Variovorax beijingensis]RRH88051.1 UDP-N-acetylglucosamine 2-epimerase (non-hydrolyzing) [Variovorax beijingensis]
MNVITVIGARPQFIKAAALSSLLSNTEGVEEHLLHTGQHFDDNMSAVFFRELGIPAPRWNLGLSGGLHGAMTGAQLAGIEAVLVNEQPDVVLLYGDTNSTLAGALAAAKLHIPVAHVEAGLRSFNRRMPEEVNRVLTDHLSNWLFTPTKTATANLEHEGIVGSLVHQVGDVMYDAALYFSAVAHARNERSPALTALSGRPFVLATIHRAENTDDLQRLRTILKALTMLSTDLDVVWPLHPRTRSVLARLGVDVSAAAGLHCIEPLGYLDMIEMEQSAQMVITDSGGVQKEAFFFGRPCVTLRDETEWVELVEAGWNRLAPPTSAEALLKAFRAALGTSGQAIEPYGRGDAARRIAGILQGSAA